MSIKFIPKIFLFLLLNTLFIPLFAQGLSEGEAEVKAKAEEYFKQQNYEQAKPYYSRLLSLYPSDPSYSYRYGACLVETNSDIPKAIKLLTFSSSKDVDKKAYYYLGHAYHLTYKFDDAIKNYNRFKETGSKSDVKELNVDQLIEMCNNGKELIRYISDLMVLENKQLKSQDFYRSYDIKTFGGQILFLPEDFKSPADKAEKVPLLMFLSEKNNCAYYASYGKNKSTGTDIYRRFRNDDGSWSEPENMGNVINTPFDENYPYIHPDGVTLYFASNGHNSMGGYDIFKSEYDPSSKTWSTPVNMDFPTNSPYDDIMFASDADNTLAFFASNRETSNDKISIYKIKVDKNPVEKEYFDIEQIQEKAKLEVSPLVANLNASETNLKIGSDLQVNSSTEQINYDNYTFANLTPTASASTTEITDEAKKDAEILKQESKNLKKDADFAYVKANQNLTDAQNKRKQAQSIYSSLNYISNETEKENKRKKAKEYEQEADKLDKEAVVSFNMAKSLEKASKQKEKDANDADQFYKKISSSDNQDANQLANEVNKNRQKLNLGQNKYTTFDAEVSNRKKQVQTKSKELETKVAKVKSVKDEADKLDKEIEKLRADINDPANTNFKSQLQQQLATKTTEYNNKKEEEQKIVAETQKLTVEVEDLNNEVVFLQSLSDDMTKTPDVSEKIAEVNMEQLSADISEKDFTADKNYADKVSEKQSDTNVTNLVTSSEKVIADTKDNNQEAADLYKQAKQNQQVADSLNLLISEKKKTLDAINNPEEKQKLENEITQLEYLAEIKKQQADKKLALAVNAEKNSPADNTKQTNFDNSVFPFASDDNQNSKQTEYEKEVFKSQYYENIASNYQKQVDVMKPGVDTISNPEIKKAVQQTITQMEATIAENKTLANTSKQNAEKIATDNPNDIVKTDISSTELMVKAAGYTPVKEAPMDNSQKDQLSTSEADKKFAETSYQNWNQYKDKADKLYAEAKKTSNEKSKAKILKQADDEFLKAQNEFNLFSETYGLVNTEEYDVYTELLEDNRFVADNDNVKLANSLENESKIYFDKAKFIRKNAPVIEDFNKKATELEKAKDFEQVAISKQKHALDLYLQAKDKGVKPSNYYAGNVTKTSSTDNQTKTNQTNKNQTPEITLLYDEEEGLKQFREKEYVANNIIDESEKQLESLTDQKKAAELITKQKDKESKLNSIKEQETKLKNNLVMAYKTHGTADSVKYNIYKNQLDFMKDSLYEVGNNTVLADQYIKEADFYFTEAKKIREDEKKAPNIDDKITKLKKATELEKKALDNQEIATNILIDAEPITFATDNSLIKVDLLEQINKPVNVDQIKALQEQQVIEKINLNKDDTEAYNLAKEKNGQADDLMAQSDILAKQAEEYKDAALKANTAKAKKKAEKEAEKTEQKSLDLKYTAAENYELVNNTLFSIYDDYIKNVRLKDNSNEARQGKQLEKDANTHFNKAKTLRDKFYNDTKTKNYKLLEDAKELELQAIEEMKKAYNIYLNIPSAEDLAKQQDSTLATNVTGVDKNLLIKTNGTITPVETDTSKSNDLMVVNYVKVDDSKTDNNPEVKTNDTKTSNTTDDHKTNIIVTDDFVDTHKTTGTITSNNPNKTSTVKTSDQGFIFGFSLKKGSPYSDANPIPMNAKLPDCIVFKIQVGAFMNPIKQNAFKSLYPMTGESLPNSKYTRYFVGLFRSIEATRMVLNEVRQMGYPDAFIVAYLDGNKISQQQALSIINSGTDECVAGYNEVAQNETQMVKSQTTTGSDVALNVTQNPNNKTKTIAETVGRQEVSSTDLKTVNGLLYTVQIGVFKAAPTSDQIKNLSPVYSESTESGFIRYTTGVFNNFEDARNEKNKIVQIGISDAFVTAYLNGKRINVDEARRMQKDQNTKMATTTSINMPSESSASTTSINSGDISFKVQVGAFEKQVPTEKVSFLLKASSKPDFQQKVNDKGITIYTVGNYKKYDDAAQMKNILVNEGITDAFVVAYSGGKQIPVEEAKKIVNQ